MENKRKNLITLQWLAVLAVSCFLLFKKGELVQDTLPLTLIVIMLVSAFVLHWLPQAAFEHKVFAPLLAVIDTALISAAIWTNREVPWDLFLVFFFCLFIAATAENLIKVVAACFLVALVSVMINPSSGDNRFWLDSDLLFRIPFLLGVSILYGYLAEQARIDRMRAEKAESTEKLKQQLVSALAHDIKNPLGVILGYAEAVQASLDGAAAKNAIEMLDRIQDNAQRIVKLVTGFLEASKAEARKTNSESKPLDLNKLIREVGQQQIALLRQKEIALELELDARLPLVLGEEVQIDRVLWNLVGNAIKFTPSGGIVKLRSWVQGGKVCFSVSDTGTGIPKEELPLLFTEFRRLRGSAKVEGTGLGLFIVKTIVEACGGTVEAQSELGKGSTFAVRFPLST